MREYLKHIVPIKRIIDVDRTNIIKMLLFVEIVMRMIKNEMYKVQQQIINNTNN